MQEYLLLRRAGPSSSSNSNFNSNPRHQQLEIENSGVDYGNSGSDCSSDEELLRYEENDIVLNPRHITSLNNAAQSQDSGSSVHNNYDAFIRNSWYSKESRKMWYSLYSRQPHAHRWIIPVNIILNVILFLWSNNSPGTSVIVQVAAPELVPSLPVQSFSTYTFSLGNSIRLMLASHSYALAFLIAVMSGAWPYIKSVMLLSCWFIPLPRTGRGKILHFLDLCGKWSMIDVFVMCLMMVAFRLNIHQVGINVDVVVEPEFGIYSFTAAAIWNLATSQVVTYLHDHAAKKKEILRGDYIDRRTRKNNRPGVFHKFLKNKSLKILIRILLFITFALTVLSQCTLSFAFNFEGITGSILGPKASFSEYSIVTCGMSIYKVSAGVGPAILCIFFFVFACIMPLLNIIGLIFLWDDEMLTLRHRFLLWKILQVLHAWATLDVFFVGVIASILEIGKMSRLIVMDKCDLINAISKQQCFKVDSTLRGGMYIMGVAIVMWWGMHTLVMNVAGHKIEKEKIQQLEIDVYQLHARRSNTIN